MEVSKNVVESNIIAELYSNAFDDFSNGNAVHDKESGTTYVICDYEENPAYYIKTNGFLHKALVSVNIPHIEKFSAFFAEYGVSLNNVIEQFLKDNPDVSEKWKSLRKDYDDMFSWSETLTQISDGYSDTFKNDLINFTVDVEDYYTHVIFKIFHPDVIEKYFSYEDSTVQDLSMKNGKRHFCWVGLNRLTMGIQNDVNDLLMSALGGRFCGYDIEDGGYDWEEV